VDDSGTAWPLDANVSRDVFGTAGDQRLPIVYLHSKERVRVSHRVDLAGSSASDLPQLVAPILGEYAMRRHEELLLSAAASRSAALEGGAAAARGAGPVSMLAARRKAICIVLAYLIVVIAMSLAIVALGTPTRPSSLLKLADSFDKGNSIGGVTWRYVSSWSEVGTIAMRTIYTSLSVADVFLVMPMRFYQTRVRAYNITPMGSSATSGEDQCPAFQVPMSNYPDGRGVTNCYPGLNGATAAEQSFFQGLPNEAELEEKTANSSMAEAYTWQSNPWTLRDRLSYPPSASPDIPATELHPSAGFLYDVDLENGKLPSDTPAKFDALPVPWLDAQTRYFSVEAVYADPNQGSLTLLHFVFTADELGAFKSLTFVARVPLLSETWRNVMFSASAAALIALLVIAYQRVLKLAGVRAAHAALASERIATERRERLTRRANLASGIDGGGDTAVARHRVSLVRVFFDWLFQFWTLVDLAIIGCALAAVILGLMTVQSSRIGQLHLPSERFVTLDTVGNWAWQTRVFAVHAIVLVMFMLLVGYNPFAVYTVKEVGAVWYGLRYLAPLGLLLFCLIIAFAYVVRLTAPASVDGASLGDFLFTVADWTTIVFGLNLTQAPLVPEWWVPVSLVVLPAAVFVLLRFSVGLAYQSIIQVSSEAMSMQELEGDSHRLHGVTEQIAAAARSWYRDSRLGKPNY
jgi:hypothetical protein